MGRWLGLWVLCMCSVVVAQPRQVSYQGLAYDLESGELLYQEFHQQQWLDGSPQQGEVTYKYPDGRLMASKQIDFRVNTQMPAFRLLDSRDGYEEGSEWLQDELQVFYRLKQDSPLEKTLLEPDSPGVIDAGFDQFVRERWDELLLGDPLVFYFIAPIEHDSFRFRITKVDDIEFEGRDAVRIKMTLDNVVLRWLLEPIWLVYDAETQRILEYKGITNVNNDEGKNFHARILYQYPDNFAAAN